MSDRTTSAASAVAAALDWAYARATSVVPGLGSAEDLAKRHLSKAGNSEDAIDDLIRWQTAFAGAAGAVANLGGLITLPIALPASMASTLLIQLRMITAIAILRGYDPADDRVRAASFMCLAGSTGSQAMGEAGMTIGSRLLSQASSVAIARIKQAVGARLAARAGAGGLARFVPLVGGLVGGGIDAAVTRAVGAVAKQYFPPLAQPDNGTGRVIDGEPLA